MCCRETRRRKPWPRCLRNQSHLAGAARLGDRVTTAWVIAVDAEGSQPCPAYPSAVHPISAPRKVPTQAFHKAGAQGHACCGPGCPESSCACTRLHGCTAARLQSSGKGCEPKPQRRLLGTTQFWFLGDGTCDRPSWAGTLKSFLPFTARRP